MMLSLARRSLETAQTLINLFGCREPSEKNRLPDGGIRRVRIYYRASDDTGASDTYLHARALYASAIEIRPRMAQEDVMFNLK